MVKIINQYSLVQISYAFHTSNFSILSRGDPNRQQLNTHQERQNSLLQLIIIIHKQLLLIINIITIIIISLKSWARPSRGNSLPKSRRDWIWANPSSLEMESALIKTKKRVNSRASLSNGSITTICLSKQTCLKPLRPSISQKK